MEYAVVLVALGLVVSVRAFLAMALNKQEPTLRKVTTQDRELGSKVAALEATERQLSREKKAAEDELQQLESEKDRLLVVVQKFGAPPVEAPTDKELFGRKARPGRPSPSRRAESCSGRTRAGVDGWRKCPGRGRWV